MTIKEQLLLAIDTLPADRLPALLSIVESLANAAQTVEQTAPKLTHTGSNLSTYFQNPENRWSGDDLEECLEIVINSRSPLMFNNRINPCETAELEENEQD
ncbi:MAG: hypothetical protein HC795_11815 [Coleofasciculaceae cyanobacterium RL_1_1]|nr:hypothetical protein [Coleofasciculaceae cyanobacterium RL_1_1]